MKYNPLAMLDTSTLTFIGGSCAYTMSTKLSPAGPSIVSAMSTARTSSKLFILQRRVLFQSKNHRNMLSLPSKLDIFKGL